ncbi:hypothetical protein JOM56_006889 [Amanita muscaria]
MVSAVAVAASSSFDDLTITAQKAIKWLFYTSLRGQRAFPGSNRCPRLLMAARARQHQRYPLSEGARASSCQNELVP